MQVRKKKRRKRTRINLIRFFSFIIILVSIVYSVRWSIFESGLLDINIISVNGNTKKTDMQIIRQAGIELGNNMIFLDRDEARQKIMQDAIYSDAALKFKFPSRMEIDVVQRKTVAIVNNRTGWFYALDKNGFVFERKYNVSQLPDAPFLTVPGIKLNIGHRCTAKPLQNAWQLCMLFPSEFRKDISEITLDSSGGIVIYMNDKMKIFWGDNLDYKKKYDMLGKVTEKMKKENYLVEYVDIRYGDNPVIKLKVGR